MEKARFTLSQIVAILKEADSGVSVKDICRKHEISDATYYNWKLKYGGMEASPAAFSFVLRPKAGGFCRGDCIRRTLPLGKTSRA